MHFSFWAVVGFWIVLLLCAVICILTLVIVLEWIHSRKYYILLEQSLEQKRVHVRTILASGGPRTLAEFLAIVPDACHTCGGRRFREELIIDKAETDPQISSAQFDWRLRTPISRYYCIRCNTESLTNVGEDVHAPYLTEEEDTQLGEWPEYAITLE
jgi:hypothetical protein